jgi:hypothetical protein
MEDARLRLLLDTVVEAAAGLRRELALPPTTVRPADAVAAVAPTAQGVDDVGPRAHASDDPALLDQLLALPQVHLVVDGYNVTKTGLRRLAAGGPALAPAQRAHLARGAVGGRGDRVLRRCGPGGAGSVDDDARGPRAVQPARRDGRRS